MPQLTTQESHPEPIASETMKIEGKSFYFDLFENQRGRFVRITEKSDGRKSRIMLPAEGIEEAAALLERIADFTYTLPKK